MTRKLILMLLTFGTQVLSVPVIASYYKCTSESGEVLFQSMPCAETYGKSDVSDRPLYTVIVEGDSKFTLQVSEALALLEEKSPAEYLFVRRYVGLIKQNSFSGMEPWRKPPRFLLSDKTAFNSLTWCAAVIVHDAYHSFLYHKFKPDGAGYPAYHLFGDAASEREANLYMIRAMENIGSSATAIRHVRQQDGTHGDVNKDGKIDENDRVNW
ncbi:MAG: hypothetical protein ACJAXW_003909 [Candidatus Azotimanducaceae bacterium]|jgi:hypothetical protein